LFGIVVDIGDGFGFHAMDALEMSRFCLIIVLMNFELQSFVSAFEYLKLCNNMGSVVFNENI
jgi:hypothetical protein